MGVGTMGDDQKVHWIRNVLSIERVASLAPPLVVDGERCATRRIINIGLIRSLCEVVLVYQEDVYTVELGELGQS